MTVTVLKNSRFGNFIFNANSSATISVAGNTASSNVALGDENVTHATIFSLSWGVSNGGYWTVQHGNVSHILVNSGTLNPTNCDLPLDLKSGANIVITLTGGSGSLNVGVQKWGDNFNQTY